MFWGDRERSFTPLQEYSKPSQYLRRWFGLISLFNGILTFVDYLMPKQPLQKNSIQLIAGGGIKGISLKINAVIRLDFKLAVTVQLVSHCALCPQLRTPLVTTFEMSYIVVGSVQLSKMTVYMKVSFKYCMLYTIFNLKIWGCTPRGKFCEKHWKTIKWVWQLTVKCHLSTWQPQQKHSEWPNCSSCYQILLNFWLTQVIISNFQSKLSYINFLVGMKMKYLCLWEWN